MRLTCPNCDAQYEVPDEVIPTSGRDVQCSNCGQTWFQHHADHMPDEEGDDLDIAAPEPDEEVAPPPPPPQPDPKPERKELDPSVADILRQEAEAEQAARRTRQTSAPLETQPELGLDEADTEEDADRRSREARDRMSRMRGEETVSEAAATAAAIGSRRDLLPDIEEINSTLRSTNDRAAGMSDLEASIAAPTYQRQKRGFRWGFWLIVLVAITLITLYLFAPQLSKAVPALEGALGNYVAMVDKGRIWLDGKLQSVLAWLEAAASQSGS